MTMSNNNKRSGIEDAIKAVEKEYGIINPANKNKKPKVEIVIDQHGNFWRYTPDRSIKWRVDANGKDLPDPLTQKMRAQTAFYNKLMEEHQGDDELAGLIETEAIYKAVGASAAKWEELRRRKAAAAASGKKNIWW